MPFWTLSDELGSCSWKGYRGRRNWMINAPAAVDVVQPATAEPVRSPADPARARPAAGLDVTRAGERLQRQRARIQYHARRKMLVCRTGATWPQPC